jgi:D-sedoheptulose 7-phosphate isomerase
MKDGIQAKIKERINSSIAIKKMLLTDQIIIEQIEVLAKDCLFALRTGGKIIFAGNGGSFADAQHLSAELTSRFIFDRAPLASLALGANNSAITAIGNDYGYDQVFSRELIGIAKPEDVFVPISTSGNSLNILQAIQVAADLGITTIALTGQSGGKLKSICRCICIPSNETALIQESHIMVGHILCGLLEELYFPDGIKK